MSKPDESTTSWSLADPALSAVALHAMAEGVVIHEADGRIVAANPAASRILGLSPDQLTGRTPMDPRWRAIDGDGRDWPGDAHPAAVTLQTGEPVTDRTMGVHRPDGSLAWLSVSSYPLDLGPQRRGAVAIFIDRTDWFAADAARTQAEARLNAVFERTRVPMAVVDRRDYTIQQTNEAFVEWSGFAHAELAGMHALSLIFPTALGSVEALDRFADEHGYFESLIDALTAKGDRRSVFVTGSVIDEPGRDHGLALVQVLDLTDWLRTLEAEQRATNRFEAVFENAASPLALLELAGRPGVIDRANFAFARLVGCDVDDVIGIPLASLYTTDDQPSLLAALSALTAGETTQTEFEARLLAPDGSENQISVSLVAIDDAGNKAMYALAHLEDNRERQAREEVLSWQVEHDSLTGLANRAALTTHLARLVRDPLRRSTTSVIFFDLDGFKQVNDQHGHEAGDDVLRAVAERVTKSLRAGDVFARFGGDEFVVVLDGLMPSVVDNVADRILAAVRQPIEAGHTTVTVGASIGIAVAATAEADDVLRRADAAMYEAKRRGKGCVVRR